MSIKRVTHEELAVRAHDVTTCMEGAATSEFSTLPLLGNAVTLALHLKDVPPQSYKLIKDVALYIFHIHPSELVPVLKLLEEAEMLELISSGGSIVSVVPNIPLLGDLYSSIGEVASPRGLSEHEQLTIKVMQHLNEAPTRLDQLHSLGAEKRVLDRVLDIGKEAEFLIHKRARGKDVFLSPSYFAENSEAYTNLVAMPGGQGRVKKVLKLLKEHQGYPLATIEGLGEIAGVSLTPQDLDVLRAMAGYGFVPPPAITTTHHGENFFLFGPRPGPSRLPLNQKETYERAMALVASVRQGQFLPGRYSIRQPRRILEVFRDRGTIQANSEAWEQYRKVAAMKIGRLELIGDRHRLVFIDNEDNRAAVNMAISLLDGEEIQSSPDGEIVLALQQGESYVESIIGRKRLHKTKEITPDPETKAFLDDFILGVRP